METYACIARTCDVYGEKKDPCISTKGGRASIEKAGGVKDVQFFPPLLIGTMIVLFPPTYTGTKYLVAAFVLFVIAKILEICDDQIYRSGLIVSGHALKHVTAAVACYPILLMLQRRHPINTPPSLRVRESV